MFTLAASSGLAAKVTLRQPARARSVACASTPAKGVEAAIGDAKAACSDGSTAECAAAWDVVEEISAAKSHDKAKKAETKEDPLEKYCETDPSADECRVYSD